jgi:hypothetical protein
VGRVSRRLLVVAASIQEAKVPPCGRPTGRRPRRPRLDGVDDRRLLIVGPERLTPGVDVAHQQGVLIASLTGNSTRLYLKGGVKQRIK